MRKRRRNFSKTTLFVCKRGQVNGHDLSRIGGKTFQLDLSFSRLHQAFGGKDKPEALPFELRHWSFSRHSALLKQ
jgi:hypothetical protein